ncbi:hypothetical protein [Paenibacillus sp. MBLB4367]|uniref:hypothetical protein n=1 Tax=Paenibacillus sp. MBLB4367 TaxID=3384767 RepID=UPI003908319A
MEQSFSAIMDRLIAEQTTVTIGAGENELIGMIVAFDRSAQVFTYAERSGQVKHLIPLASVRSIGIEESAAGTLSGYLELFKR